MRYTTQSTTTFKQSPALQLPLPQPPRFDISLTETTFVPGSGDTAGMTCLTFKHMWSIPVGTITPSADYGLRFGVKLSLHFKLADEPAVLKFTVSDSLSSVAVDRTRHVYFDPTTKETFILMPPTEDLRSLALDTQHRVTLCGLDWAPADPNGESFFKAPYMSAFLAGLPPRADYSTYTFTAATHYIVAQSGKNQLPDTVTSPGMFTTLAREVIAPTILEPFTVANGGTLMVLLDDSVAEGNRVFIAMNQHPGFPSSVMPQFDAAGIELDPQFTYITGEGFRLLLLTRSSVAATGSCKLTLKFRNMLILPRQMNVVIYYSFAKQVAFALPRPTYTKPSSFATIVGYQTDPLPIIDVHVDFSSGAFTANAVKTYGIRLVGRGMAMDASDCRPQYAFSADPNTFYPFSASTNNPCVADVNPLDSGDTQRFVLTCPVPNFPDFQADSRVIYRLEDCGSLENSAGVSVDLVGSPSYSGGSAEPLASVYLIPTSEMTGATRASAQTIVEQMGSDLQLTITQVGSSAYSLNGQCTATLRIMNAARLFCPSSVQIFDGQTEYLVRLSVPLEVFHMCMRDPNTCFSSFVSTSPAVLWTFVYAVPNRSALLFRPSNPVCHSLGSNTPLELQASLSRCPLPPNSNPEVNSVALALENSPQNLFQNFPVVALKGAYTLAADISVMESRLSAVSGEPENNFIAISGSSNTFYLGNHLTFGFTVDGSPLTVHEQIVIDFHGACRKNPLSSPTYIGRVYTSTVGFDADCLHASDPHKRDLTMIRPRTELSVGHSAGIELYDMICIPTTEEIEIWIADVYTNARVSAKVKQPSALAFNLPTPVPNLIKWSVPRIDGGKVAEREIPSKYLHELALSSLPGSPSNFCVFDRPCTLRLAFKLPFILTHGISLGVTLPASMDSSYVCTGKVVYPVDVAFVATGAYAPTFCKAFALDKDMNNPHFVHALETNTLIVFEFEVVVPSSFAYFDWTGFKGSVEVLSDSDPSTRIAYTLDSAATNTIWRPSSEDPYISYPPVSVLNPRRVFVSDATALVGVTSATAYAGSIFRVSLTYTNLMHGIPSPEVISIYVPRFYSIRPYDSTGTYDVDYLRFGLSYEAPPGYDFTTDSFSPDITDIVEFSPTSPTTYTRYRFTVTPSSPIPAGLPITFIFNARVPDIMPSRAGSSAYGNSEALLRYETYDPRDPYFFKTKSLPEAAELQDIKRISFAPHPASLFQRSGWVAVHDTSVDPGLRGAKSLFYDLVVKIPAPLVVGDYLILSLPGGVSPRTVYPILSEPKPPLHCISTLSTYGTGAPQCNLAFDSCQLFGRGGSGGPEQEYLNGAVSRTLRLLGKAFNNAYSILDNTDQEQYVIKCPISANPVSTAYTNEHLVLRVGGLRYIGRSWQAPILVEVRGSDDSIKISTVSISEGPPSLGTPAATEERFDIETASDLVTPADNPVVIRFGHSVNLVFAATSDFIYSYKSSVTTSYTYSTFIQEPSESPPLGEQQKLRIRPPSATVAKSAATNIAVTPEGGFLYFITHNQYVHCVYPAAGQADGESLLRYCREDEDAYDFIAGAGMQSAMLDTRYPVVMFECLGGAHDEADPYCVLVSGYAVYVLSRNIVSGQLSHRTHFAHIHPAYSDGDGSPIAVAATVPSSLSNMFIVLMSNGDALSFVLGPSGELTRGTVQIPFSVTPPVISGSQTPSGILGMTFGSKDIITPASATDAAAGLGVDGMERSSIYVTFSGTSIIAHVTGVTVHSVMGKHGTINVKYIDLLKAVPEMIDIPPVVEGPSPFDPSSRLDLPYMPVAHPSGNYLYLISQSNAHCGILIFDRLADGSLRYATHVEPYSSATASCSFAQSYDGDAFILYGAPASYYAEQPPYARYYKSGPAITASLAMNHASKRIDPIGSGFELAVRLEIPYYLRMNDAINIALPANFFILGNDYPTDTVTCTMQSSTKPIKPTTQMTLSASSYEYLSLLQLTIKQNAHLDYGGEAIWFCLFGSAHQVLTSGAITGIEPITELTYARTRLSPVLNVMRNWRQLTQNNPVFFPDALPVNRRQIVTVFMFTPKYPNDFTQTEGNLLLGLVVPSAVLMDTPTGFDTYRATPFTLKQGSVIKIQSLWPTSVREDSTVALYIRPPGLNPTTRTGLITCVQRAPVSGDPADPIDVECTISLSGTGLSTIPAGWHLHFSLLVNAPTPSFPTYEGQAYATTVAFENLDGTPTCANNACQQTLSVLDKVVRTMPIAPVVSFPEEVFSGWGSAVHYISSESQITYLVKGSIMSMGRSIVCGWYSGTYSIFTVCAQKTNSVANSSSETSTRYFNMERDQFSFNQGHSRALPYAPLHAASAVAVNPVTRSMYYALGNRIYLTGVLYDRSEDRGHTQPGITRYAADQTRTLALDYTHNPPVERSRISAMRVGRSAFMYGSYLYVGYNTSHVGVVPLSPYSYHPVDPHVHVASTIGPFPPFQNDDYLTESPDVARHREIIAIYEYTAFTANPIRPLTYVYTVSRGGTVNVFVQEQHAQNEGPFNPFAQTASVAGLEHRQTLRGGDVFGNSRDEIAVIDAEMTPFTNVVHFATTRGKIYRFVFNQGNVGYQAPLLDLKQAVTSIVTHPSGTMLVIGTQAGDITSFEMVPAAQGGGLRRTELLSHTRYLKAQTELEHMTQFSSGGKFNSAIQAMHFTDRGDHLVVFTDNLVSYLVVAAPILSVSLPLPLSPAANYPGEYALSLDLPFYASNGVDVEVAVEFPPGTDLREAEVTMHEDNANYLFAPTTVSSMFSIGNTLYARLRLLSDMNMPVSTDSKLVLRYARIYNPPDRSLPVYSDARVMILKPDFEPGTIKVDPGRTKFAYFNKLTQVSPTNTIGVSLEVLSLGVAADFNIGLTYADSVDRYLDIVFDTAASQTHKCIVYPYGTDPEASAAKNELRGVVLPAGQTALSFTVRCNQYSPGVANTVSIEIIDVTPAQTPLSVPSTSVPLLPSVVFSMVGVDSSYRPGVAPAGVYVPLSLTLSHAPAETLKLKVSAAGSAPCYLYSPSYALTSGEVEITFNSGSTNPVANTIVHPTQGTAFPYHVYLYCYGFESQSVNAPLTFVLQTLAMKTTMSTYRIEELGAVISIRGPIETSFGLPFAPSQSDPIHAPQTLQVFLSLPPPESLPLSVSVLVGAGSAAVCRLADATVGIFSPSPISITVPGGSSIVGVSVTCDQTFNENEMMSLVIRGDFGVLFFANTLKIPLVSSTPLQVTVSHESGLPVTSSPIAMTLARAQPHIVSLSYADLHQDTVLDVQPNLTGCLVSTYPTPDAPTSVTWSSSIRITLREGTTGSPNTFLVKCDSLIPPALEDPQRRFLFKFLRVSGNFITPVAHLPAAVGNILYPIAANADNTVPPSLSSSRRLESRRKIGDSFHFAIAGSGSPATVATQFTVNAQYPCVLSLVSPVSYDPSVSVTIAVGSTTTPVLLAKCEGISTTSQLTYTITAQSIVPAEMYGTMSPSVFTQYVGTTTLGFWDSNGFYDPVEVDVTNLPSSVAPEPVNIPLSMPIMVGLQLFPPLSEAQPSRQYTISIPSVCTSDSTTVTVNSMSSISSTILLNCANLRFGPKELGLALVGPLVGPDTYPVISKVPLDIKGSLRLYFSQSDEEISGDQVYAALPVFFRIQFTPPSPFSHIMKFESDPDGAGGCQVAISDSSLYSNCVSVLAPADQWEVSSIVLVRCSRVATAGFNISVQSVDGLYPTSGQGLPGWPGVHSTVSFVHLQMASDAEDQQNVFWIISNIPYDALLDSIPAEVRGITTEYELIVRALPITQPEPRAVRIVFAPAVVSLTQFQLSFVWSSGSVLPPCVFVPDIQQPLVSTSTLLVTMNAGDNNYVVHTTCSNVDFFSIRATPVSGDIFAVTQSNQIAALGSLTIQNVPAEIVSYRAVPVTVVLSPTAFPTPVELRVYRTETYLDTPCVWFENPPTGNQIWATPANPVYTWSVQSTDHVAKTLYLMCMVTVASSNYYVRAMDTGSSTVYGSTVSSDFRVTGLLLLLGSNSIPEPLPSNPAPFNTLPPIITGAWQRIYTAVRPYTTLQVKYTLAANAGDCVIALTEGGTNSTTELLQTITSSTLFASVYLRCPTAVTQASGPQLSVAPATGSNFQPYSLLRYKVASQMSIAKADGSAFPSSVIFGVPTRLAVTFTPPPALQTVLVVAPTSTWGGCQIAADEGNKPAQTYQENYAVAVSAGAAGFNFWLRCPEETVTVSDQYLSITSTSGTPYWDLKSPRVVGIVIQCTGLPAPANGMVTYINNGYGELAYQATALYTCNTGYAVQGIASRTCTESATWSGTAPTCEVFTCPTLPVALPDGFGAAVTYTPNSQGLERGLDAIATYTCVSGYEPLREGVENPAQRKCTYSGWDGVPPICGPVACPSLPLVSDGNAIQYSAAPNGVRKYLGTATYTCGPGFQLTGDDTRQCQADGQWSGVEPTCTAQSCTTLQVPAKANPIVYSGDSVAVLEGDTATYSCPIGYTLFGASVRTCGPSGWLGTSPRCIPRQCGPAPAYQFGFITYSNPEGNGFEEFGSVATLGCINGFDLLSTIPVNRTCTENGVWTNQNGACEPHDCGSIGTPQYSSAVDVTQGLYGDNKFTSTVNVTCQAGFNVRVPSLSSCTATGWNPSPATCEPQDCGPLVVPELGIVITYSNGGHGMQKLNSVATYLCIIGYSPQTATGEVHPGTRTCRANGWDATAPICRPYNCGKLQKPTFGSVQYADFGQGETNIDAAATYSCGAGFHLSTTDAKAIAAAAQGGVPVGNVTRTCMSTGWSGNAPWCIDDNECDVINCAALYGAGSRCHNIDGSYVCTPYILLGSLTATSNDDRVNGDRSISISSAFGGRGLRFNYFAGFNTLRTGLSTVEFEAAEPLFAGAPPLRFVGTDLNVTVINHPGIGGRPVHQADVFVPPGQGRNLYISLRFCHLKAPESLEEVCVLQWKSTDRSVNNNYRITYPTPTFVPISLRSITYNTVPTASYVGLLSKGETMAISANNLWFSSLFPPSLFFGPPEQPLKYNLMVDMEATGAIVGGRPSALIFTMPDGLDEVENIYSLSIAGQPYSQSTDTYSYPQVPVIEKVSGCSGFDPATNSTFDCPTAGGIVITVQGTGMLAPLTAFVNGRQCTDIVRSGTTKFTCVLPHGTGLAHPVLVKAGTQRGESRERLSYAIPTVEGVQGCSSPNAPAKAIIECNRMGGEVITVFGKNFGVEGASVSVGGIACLAPKHDPDAPNEILRCTTSGGSLTTRTISVFQRYGELSVDQVTLSYVQCPPGQHDFGNACRPCSRGEYNDLWSQPSCKFCPAGSFSATPGAQNCTECEAGKFSPQNSQSCTDCPRGYFSQRNSASCTECGAGTYAKDEGQRVCQPCMQGGESEIDFTFCKCKSGYFMTPDHECLECMPGGNCTEAGTNAFNVVPVTGYFPSISTTSTDFVKHVVIPFGAQATSEEERKFVRELVIKALFDGSSLTPDRVVISQIADRELRYNATNNPTIKPKSVRVSRLNRTADAAAAAATAAAQLMGDESALTDDDEGDAPPEQLSAVEVLTRVLNVRLPVSQPVRIFSRSDFHDKDGAASIASTGGDDSSNFDVLSEVIVQGSAITVSVYPGSGAGNEPVTNVLVNEIKSRFSNVNSTGSVLLGEYFVPSPLQDASTNRYGVQTFQVCLNDACLDGGQCSEGHTGNLCTTCESGFGKTAVFKCSRCASGATRWSILVGGICGAIVLCGFLSWKQIVDGKKAISDIAAPAIPIVLKVGISGIQVMAIAARYDLRWPGILEYFFTSADTTGGLGVTVVTLDCFLPEDPAIPPFWITTLAFLLLPVLALMLPAIVFSCMYYFNWKKAQHEAQKEMKDWTKFQDEIVKEYRIFVDEEKKRKEKEKEMEEYAAYKASRLGNVWDERKAAALEAKRTKKRDADGNIIPSSPATSLVPSVASLRRDTLSNIPSRLTIDSNAFLSEAELLEKAREVKRAKAEALRKQREATQGTQRNILRRYGGDDYASSYTTSSPMVTSPASVSFNASSSSTNGDVNSQQHDPLPPPPDPPTPPQPSDDANNTNNANSNGGNQPNLERVVKVGQGVKLAFFAKRRQTSASENLVAAELAAQEAAEREQARLAEEEEERRRRAHEEAMAEEEAQFRAQLEATRALLAASASDNAVNGNNNVTAPSVNGAAAANGSVQMVGGGVRVHRFTPGSRPPRADGAEDYDDDEVAAAAAAGGANNGLEEDDDPLGSHGTGVRRESVHYENIGAMAGALADDPDYDGPGSMYRGESFISTDGNLLSPKHRGANLRSSYSGESVSASSGGAAAAEDGNNNGGNSPGFKKPRFVRVDTSKPGEVEMTPFGLGVRKVINNTGGAGAAEEKFEPVTLRQLTPEEIKAKEDELVEGDAVLARMGTLTRMSSMKRYDPNLILSAEQHRDRCVRNERRLAIQGMEARLRELVNLHGIEKGRRLFEKEKNDQIARGEQAHRYTASELRRRMFSTLIRHDLLRMEHRGYFLTTLTVILFLIHPNITRQFFLMLSCKQLGPSSQDSFLLGDMSRMCYDSEHMKYIFAVGIPMALLWVFGIPCFAFFVLYTHRDLIYMPSLNITESDLKRKKAFEAQAGFLYRGYKPERYYWFLLEMFRKVALVAIAVFFPGALHTQLLLASMLLFVCLVLQVAGRPFENPVPEFVEFLSLLICFMIFFLANFLFVDISELNKQVITVIILVLGLTFVIVCLFAIATLIREERELTGLRKMLANAQARGENTADVLARWRAEQARKKMDKSIFDLIAQRKAEDKATEEKEAAMTQRNADEIVRLKLDLRPDTRTEFQKKFLIEVDEDAAKDFAMQDIGTVGATEVDPRKYEVLNLHLAGDADEEEEEDREVEANVNLLFVDEEDEDADDDDDGDGDDGGDNAAASGADDHQHQGAGPGGADAGAGSGVDGEEGKYRVDENGNAVPIVPPKKSAKQTRALTEEEKTALAERKAKIARHRKRRILEEVMPGVVLSQAGGPGGEGGEDGAADEDEEEEDAPDVFDYLSMKPSEGYINNAAIVREKVLGKEGYEKYLAEVAKETQREAQEAAMRANKVLQPTVSPH